MLVAFLLVSAWAKSQHQHGAKHSKDQASGGKSAVPLQSVEEYVDEAEIKKLQDLEAERKRQKTGNAALLEVAVVEPKLGDLQSVQEYLDDGDFHELEKKAKKSDPAHSLIMIKGAATTVVDKTPQLQQADVKNDYLVPVPLSLLEAAAQAVAEARQSVAAARAKVTKAAQNTDTDTNTNSDTAQANKESKAKNNPLMSFRSRRLSRGAGAKTEDSNSNSVSDSTQPQSADAAKVMRISPLLTAAQQFRFAHHSVLNAVRGNDPLNTWDPYGILTPGTEALGPLPLVDSSDLDSATLLDSALGDSTVTLAGNGLGVSAVGVAGTGLGGGLNAGGLTPALASGLGTGLDLEDGLGLGGLGGVSIGGIGPAVTGSHVTMPGPPPPPVRPDDLPPPPYVAPLMKKPAAPPA